MSKHEGIAQIKPGINRRALLGTAATGAGLLPFAGSARAQSAVTAIRMMQQNGLMYLPMEMMVHAGILKRQAKKLGLANVETSAQNVAGAAVINDAMLSGAIEAGSVAIPSLLTLWDKARGTPNEVRAIGTMSNAPMTLYTINPNVKTLADFGETDRIAVPSIKVSWNAIMLAIAAEKQLGSAAKLDPLTVQMSHPDAIAAIGQGFGKSPITAHVAIEPFTSRALQIPGVRVVADSLQIFGGHMSQVVLACTRRFKEGNPQAFKALGAALEESIKTVNADKKAACEVYKSVTKASESVDQLTAQVSDPRFEFTSTPKRIMELADFFHRNGRIKSKPESWKDLFWETAHHQQGT